MREESRNTLDRREFLKAGLTAAAALPIAGALFGARSARAQSVMEVESMKPTVQALQYTDTSDKPDQTCANCQFYTPGEGGSGKCQLFVEGTVTDGGWCMSWTKKVDTP
jgi:anaerobic selenocysteine-containing dehydrogenase